MKLNNLKSNSERQSISGRDKHSDKSFSALGLAWQMGYTIAVPIVALALAGRFLDKKMGTSPWLLLAGILLSIAISSYVIYKKTLDIIGK